LAGFAYVIDAILFYVYPLTLRLQVVSPFQEILNYEIKNNIPPGWVNHSISKTAPNGTWHKQERGETPMDAKFFEGFNRDLRDPQRWDAFYRQAMKKEGIVVDKVPPVPEVDAEWLFWEMMRASRAPDPWMWPALQKLKASGKYLMAALSNTMIYPEGHEFNTVWPNDVRGVFDLFISSAHVGLRKPDPKIYELALKMLNEYAKENANGRGKDLGWGDGVKPEEIVFLDDIGENLKAAKKAGFGTIKVHLGQAYDAVEALEKLTGLDLAGDHPKISSAPKIPKLNIAKL
jgi:FMN phosphatase YigB (HAD superfamily)